MAHRQWSQEQYGFKFYKLNVFIYFDVKPLVVSLNSDEGSNKLLGLNTPPGFLFNSSVFNFFKLKYKIPATLFIL